MQRSIDRRACDLTDIARDVVVELNAVAEDRGVSIDIVDSGESSTVSADRERIAQVIRNLLSNALKVSPTGSRITVHMDVAENLVSAHIVDQGPGIPADELDSIFDKFVQSLEQTLERVAPDLVYQFAEKLSRGTAEISGPRTCHPAVPRFAFHFLARFQPSKRTTARYPIVQMPRVRGTRRIRIHVWRLPPTLSHNHVYKKPCFSR